MMTMAVTTMSPQVLGIQLCATGWTKTSANRILGRNWLQAPCRSHGLAFQHTFKKASGNCSLFPKLYAQAASLTTWEQPLHPAAKQCQSNQFQAKAIIFLPF
jgi:hypothetical protein